MTESLRVALLRCDDAHQLYLEARLAERFELVGVVVESNRSQRARLLRRALWRPWLWRQYHALRQRWTGRAAYSRQYFGSFERPDLARLDVPWVNDGAVAAALGDWRPDITVVCGTSIIREETLAAAGRAINIHGGCLPWYRGNHGVFFAYQRGEFERIGATVHLVTAQLDSGDVLAVVRPEIFPHDHDGHLYCRSVQLAVDTLVDLLTDLQSGRPLTPTSQGDGEIFRHRDRTPAIEARLWLRRRTGRHPVPHLPASVERSSAAVAQAAPATADQRGSTVTTAL
jgi:hypothetical protein